MNEKALTPFMAYPDFSELTFSFAFLNELQWFLWRNSPVMHPWIFMNFLTVHQEIKVGADVVFNNGLTPIYIQFKRSGIIKGQNGRTPKELKPNQSGNHQFTLNQRPFYRMHLHKHMEYLQHFTLQVQEVIANQRVFYVTSQVPDIKALQDCVKDRSVFSDASAFFLPSEIILPTDVSNPDDLKETHWVSFSKNDTHKVVYSEIGVKTPRAFQRSANFSESLYSWVSEKSPADRTKHELKKSIELIISAFGINEKNLPEGFRDGSLVYQAKYLHRYYLDTEIFFV
ncbi:hypothetical protein [Litorimonas sp. WD9-15]|uniref:hypothetical protein n=1 Tax=Litorimonas sp. WD9-15 TaxID=3418716 RepID=UPI003D03482A